jgi:hypothetical protein
LGIVWHFSRCLIAALLVLVFVYQAVAGHGYGRGERYRKRGRSGWANQYNTYTPNPLHKKVCGECHFALPAMLLPAASWNKIMNGMGNHFGEAVELDAPEKSAVADFLRSNAADVSGCKHARRIMRCLGSNTPIRVTEIPYLKRMHNRAKVPAGAFQRKSVGSMANCIACHPGADQADFNDHRVRIPD